MWENETLARARQAFAGQFEAAEGGILYRRRGQGEPALLTVWERDALISAFHRRVAWLYAALIVAMGLVLLGAWAAATVFRLRLTLPGIVLVLGPVALAYVLADRWIWDAPQRLLARRAASPASRARPEP